MKIAGGIDDMKAEIRALEDNKTWVVTNLPQGKKPIGCRWVYKLNTSIFDR